MSAPLFHWKNECINSLMGKLAKLQLYICVSLGMRLGEDGQLMVWHALTYQREATLDLALERAWSLSIRDSAACEAESGSGAALGGLVLAVGGDAGSLILKVSASPQLASEPHLRRIFGWRSSEGALHSS